MPEHEADQDICLRRSPAGCSDCSIKDSVECQFQRRSLIRFAVLFLFCATPAFMGVILAGFGWFLIGWALYIVFFLQIWENRILCSHCPYYAEEGRSLRCHANYGLLKIWKFNPGPMSRWEKLQFMLGIIIFVTYPLPFMAVGGQYSFFLLSSLGILVFFAGLRLKSCIRCVNFSCPLNRVPKEVVDTFLRLNPVMRRAWEEAGYKVGNE